LVSEVSKEIASSLLSHGVYVMPTADVRSWVRPLLVKRQSALAAIARAADLDLPPGINRVVISGHGMLCDKTEIVGDDGLYAAIAPAVQGLAAFFHDVRVVVHILTPPQHDFAPVSDGICKVGHPISWIPVVKGLADAMPGAKIVVWPVEQKEVHAVDVLSGIFGMQLTGDEQAVIRRIAAQQRFAVPQLRITHATTEMSLYMDEVFARDIQELAAMLDVTLGIATEA
jgi:hypothetical protein